jgi:Na+-driven multidrug efflux pump
MLDHAETKVQAAPSNIQIAKEILSIAGPVLVTLLSWYLIDVISIAFTGHLSDPSIIAGAGLGSM